MKKSFLILLLASLTTLSGCGSEPAPTPTPDPEPTPTPTPTPCEHVDENKDHYCDKCKLKLSEHTYSYFENDTHKCSYCGDIQKCVDSNGDNHCDICDHEKEEEPEQTYVADYVVSGSYFKETFTNGTQFGEDHTANNDKLKGFLNDQYKEQTVISSIECKKLTCLDDLGTDGNRFLTVGSSSDGGSLVINSEYSISKVVVKAKNYFKKYTDHTGEHISLDKLSHLYIDNEDFSLEMTEEKIPETGTYSKEYSVPVKSFKLANPKKEKCRVFLESISITFAA